MKILYDHQAFTMQTHGGVSRCFVEIYKHLPKDVKAQFSVNESDNAYLREMGIGVPRGYGYNHFLVPFHFPMKGRLFAMWNRFCYGMPYQSGNEMYFYGQGYVKQESIKQLKKGDFDVFHPTFFDDYFLPYLNGKPFVLTIHDMIPELYPQYFSHETDMQILGKKKLVPLASAIIAVSEQTKEDVIRILNVPEEKVHVIYHGSEHIAEHVDLSKYTDIKEFPLYILYVGDRNLYKDFDLFLKYVSPVLITHPELNVVCTGKNFNDEEISLMNSFGIRDRFIRYWVATDDEFSALYHNAICFVYTSEYEGFGIPILEAYKADCPVMLNRASCFPEIAGDAAIYFELKKEYSDFADRFEELYSSSTKNREELIKKQKVRLELYSWEKSAKQLANVYASVIK